MSLVKCFKSIINAAFHLDTTSQPEGVVVQEKGSNDDSSSLTFVGGKNIACFGFVAEAGNPEPLALLGSQNMPGVGLTDVRKMCDGIVIFSQSEREYILGVEMKSGSTKNAHRQIRNGEILCEWLIKLLREYEHWDGNYTFHGVIAKSPRKINDKGTTRHNDRYLEMETCGGRKNFRLRNCNKAYLIHIAKRIQQA